MKRKNMEISEDFEDKAQIDFNEYSLEEELEKVKGLGVSGYKVLLRIYQEKKQAKTASGLWLDPKALTKEAEDAKFRSPVGLVLKIAPGAYKDEKKFKDTAAYCKVGDWVRLPRFSGSSICYDGVDYLDIDDDLIIGTVDDPRKCTLLKSKLSY